MKLKQIARGLLTALLLTLPATGQAQFTFTTNNGAITITGYNGSPTNVIIPSTTNGYPVTSIGEGAFYGCASLTHIIIGTNVVGIGQAAFYECGNLANVTIPDGVASIGGSAFQYCRNLTNVIIGKKVTAIGDGAFTCCGLVNARIPNSVTSIGWGAFYGCPNLTSVIIGTNVNTISQAAFYACSSLASVFFEGKMPTNVSTYVFLYAPKVIVYYLAANSDWGATFAGVPTAPWLPSMQTSDASFGIQPNQFGFNIEWASGQTVVVDACTNLFNPDWQPVQTNTLPSSGAAAFSDPQWTNYPGRFYRLRSP